jgi:hypothetical protein
MYTPVMLKGPRQRFVKAELKSESVLRCVVGDFPHRQGIRLAIPTLPHRAWDLVSCALCFLLDACDDTAPHFAAYINQWFARALEHFCPPTMGNAAMSGRGKHREFSLAHFCTCPVDRALMTAAACSLPSSDTSCRQLAVNTRHQLPGSCVLHSHFRMQALCCFCS